MLHVCVMHISMMRIKHVSMMHACVMHVKNGDERTDGKTNQPTNQQGDSRSRMQYADTYEACIYDACMCDACQKWGGTDEWTES